MEIQLTKLKVVRILASHSYILKCDKNIKTVPRTPAAIEKCIKNKLARLGKVYTY